MQYNTKKTENSYIIEIDAPSFKKEDINIELVDSYLYVNGASPKGRLLNYVFSVNNTYQPVNEENIQAKVEDGLLEITIPFKEKKRIKIF